MAGLGVKALASALAKAVPHHYLVRPSSYQNVYATQGMLNTLINPYLLNWEGSESAWKPSNRDVKRVAHEQLAGEAFASEISTSEAINKYGHTTLGYQEDICSQYVDNLLELPLDALKASNSQIRESICIARSQQIMAPVFRFNHFFAVSGISDKIIFAKSNLFAPKHSRGYVPDKEVWPKMIGAAKQIKQNTDRAYTGFPLGTPFAQWPPEALMAYNSMALHCRGQMDNIVASYVFPEEHPFPVANIILDYKSMLITPAGLSQLLWYMASSAITNVLTNGVDKPFEEPLLRLGVVSDGRSYVRLLVFQLNSVDFDSENPIYNYLWYHDFPLQYMPPYKNVSKVIELLYVFLGATASGDSNVLAPLFPQQGMK